MSRYAPTEHGSPRGVKASDRTGEGFKMWMAIDKIGRPDEPSTIHGRVSAPSKVEAEGYGENMGGPRERVATQFHARTIMEELGLEQERHEARLVHKETMLDEGGSLMPRGIGDDGEGREGGIGRRRSQIIGDDMITAIDEVIFNDFTTMGTQNVGDMMIATSDFPDLSGQGRA